MDKPKQYAIFVMKSTYLQKKSWKGFVTKLPAKLFSGFFNLRKGAESRFEIKNNLDRYFRGAVGLLYCCCIYADEIPGRRIAVRWVYCDDRRQKRDKRRMAERNGRSIWKVDTWRYDQCPSRWATRQKNDLKVSKSEIDREFLLIKAVNNSFTKTNIQLRRSGKTKFVIISSLKSC